MIDMGSRCTDGLKKSGDKLKTVIDKIQSRRFLSRWFLSLS